MENRTNILIKSFLRGEQEAFGELVGLYQNQVFNLAYRFLGTREEAEDAAQEAFIRAYQRFHTFRGEGNFGGWLRKITINICIDLAKKRTRERHRVTTFGKTEAPPGQRSIQPEDNPNEVLARQEINALVQQAVSQLPEHYRSVLVLFDLEGLSYEQISKTLGLRTGTVRSRLNRARLMLKDKLKDVLPLNEGKGA